MHKPPTGWKRLFEDPIDLPRGRQLVTLEDAADYIMKLPKAKQRLEPWQTATEAFDHGCGRSRAIDACAHRRHEGIEPKRREDV